RAVSRSPGCRPALLALCERTYPVTVAGMVMARSRWPALSTRNAVITLVMLAIGRLVFRPRVHSSRPVAAFSTAADQAPTRAGPAEEALLAAWAVAPAAWTVAPAAGPG